VARGLCHEVVRLVIRLHAVVTSVALLDELERTLRDKFEVTPEVAAFLKQFRTAVRIVTPVRLPSPVCRDADDDVVLATAIAAGADFIVTGDNDLLVLRSYEGIRISSPREFLMLLEPPIV
jgi:putative PIN family toxin of toxin-antitoxin system